MQITFKKYDASEFDKNVKATIQRSGKLGFSESAIKKLDLANKKGFIIGKNEEDPNDENLYMVLVDEESADAFRLNKAGAYYYSNTKALFDSIGMDYQHKTIIFDITQTEVEHEGKKLYKLIKREIQKNNNSKEKEENEGGI